MINSRKQRKLRRLRNRLERNYLRKVNYQKTYQK